MTDKLPGGTKIAPCTCAHEFQDRTYGRGQRVHNRTVKGYRCTVCRRETT